MDISRRAFVNSACAAPFALASPSIVFAAVDPDRRVSGPFVHENLAIYFVHGRSAPGVAPLTLAEAMAEGKVHVFETGNVSELVIENIGDDEVFVQAGDIVKGGKQDRVLTVSLVVPGKSGKMPISAYCVEQGRWQARGREDVSRFASAQAALPSREAKLAMKVAQAASAPADPTQAGALPVGRHDAPTRPAPSAQGKVWESVARTQRDLSRSVGAPVAAAQSATSMQLTLENKTLKATQASYEKSLGDKGLADDDVVGYVFAVNGKINSADIYPSNALFRKMWRKNFDASVTEALAAKGEGLAEAPQPAAVLAFLDAAEAGKPSEREVAGRTRLETREGVGNFMFETRSAKGAYLHRNYLAK